MSTRCSRTLIGLIVACMTAGDAAAQGSAPAGCTYATCALRVEPSFFLAPRLVRGASGEMVSRLGGFGGGLDLLLHGPDSAATHGRSYVTSARRATTLGLIATAAYVVVLVRTDTFRDDFDDASVATSLVGAGFGIGAIPFALKAQRELARAVWWYNSALPR
jgi:hypothetical protein